MPEFTGAGKVPDWITDILADLRFESPQRCPFAVLKLLHELDGHSIPMIDVQRAFRREYTPQQVSVAIDQLERDGRIEIWESGWWAPTRISLPHPIEGESDG